MEVGISIFKSSIPTLSALMSKNLPMGAPPSQVVATVMNEIENLKWIQKLKPELFEGTDEDSIRYAMRKVISQNLSFDLDAKLVYLTTRMVKIGGKDVKILEATPSVDGEISQYRQCGTLSHVNPPVVSYDPDGNVESIYIELIVPVFNERGEVIRHDTMPFNYNKSHFRNWQAYSHRQNSRGKKPADVNNTLMNWSNKNYTNYYPNNPAQAHSYETPGSIQPGFAITKCIKHALNNAHLDKNPYGRRAYGNQAPISPIADFTFEDADYSEIIEKYTFEDAEVVTDEAHSAQAQQTQAAPPPPPPPAQPEIKPQTQPTPKPTPPPAAQASTPPPVQTPPPAAQTHQVIPDTADPMEVLFSAVKKENYDLGFAMKSATTSDEVKAVWKANGPRITQDANLMKYMKMRGKFLEDREKGTKTPVTASSL